MRRYTIVFGILLLLASTLVGGCDRPSSVRPVVEPGLPLLTFERSGGIAGFQDKLVIGYGGEYYLSRGGQADRIGSLGAERRTQLETWLNRLAPFTIKFEDNPGGPDNMVRRLVWTGLGRVNANEAQQQEVLNWVNGLFEELGTAGD